MHDLTPIHARQKGVAMVLMLWLLAGLTLMVSHQIGSLRAELRSTETFIIQSQFSAIADGAIRIMAAELLTIEAPTNFPRKSIEFEGMPVDVLAVPSSAFVDLNHAPPDLLRDLLLHGAGLSIDQANHLTTVIVAWRDPAGATLSDYAPALFEGVASADLCCVFESIDDLMQVPHMNLSTFDRLFDLVTVHSGMDGVDPRFAPTRLLSVLTKGNEQRSARIANARDANDPVLDIADLPYAWISHSHQSHYRITVTSKSNDRTLTRTRWVALQRAPYTGLPWRELPSEPLRIHPEDRIAAADSAKPTFRP